MVSNTSDSQVIVSYGPLRSVVNYLLVYNYSIKKRTITINYKSNPMQTDSKHTDYKPFKYPPDYALARVHQQATMPGKPNLKQPSCPCCHEPVKIPFKTWWDRSIQQDYKHYGGAIVSYFWLLRLYSISIIAVIVVYAAYLQYLCFHYCEQLTKEIEQQFVCSRLFGVWIVTNQDLYSLIKERGDQDTLVRFFTLRAMAFLVLLITNVLSLHIMKWFKVRFPDKVDISTFSILFKNLKTDNIQDLLRKIEKEFGQVNVKEAFIIKKIEPFYTSYQQKIDIYYACRNEGKTKKYFKLIQQLHNLDKFCSETEQTFYNHGNRAIIVFNSLLTQQNILKRYKISKWNRFLMFFNNGYEEKHITYCQQCPRPQQIIWNNIGKVEKQGFKLKLLSIAYFFLILGIIFLFMYFALQVVYLYKIAEPWKTILQNIILLFIVAVALTFRQLMNKLSQMRFPNTYTNRSMFIVITTVLFHFLFYLLIPSLYLRFNVDKRGELLNLISNQSITFIIVQITLAGFDLMYCCWNKRKAKIEDQSHPVGCQKILHQKMQYPRFPIQFKLIILFKIWSFITFFAFQVPMVLFLILIVLLFLYIKDKMNLYYHYRIEIIDNQVEFNFLRIYSNFFTLYLFFIFVFTRHEVIQYLIGAGITIITMLFQTLFFTRLKDQTQTTSDSFTDLTLSQIDFYQSYKDKYQQFLDVARCDILDGQIKQYLSKQGYGTMRTEQSLSSRLV